MHSIQMGSVQSKDRATSPFKNVGASMVSVICHGLVVVVVTNCLYRLFEFKLSKQYRKIKYPTILRDMQWK